MATSINEVRLLGNLARDPEIRTNQQGKKFASIAVATNKNWKDRETGEWKQKSQFHQIVVFNDHLANKLEQCRKGARLMVMGELRNRKWQDQNGNDRFSVEVTIDAYEGDIVFLDAKEGDGQNRGQQNDRRQQDNRGYDDRRQQGGGGQQSNGNANQNRNQGGGGVTARGGGGQGGYGGGAGGGGNQQQSRGPSFNQQLDDEIPF